MWAERLNRSIKYDKKEYVEFIKRVENDGEAGWDVKAVDVERVAGCLGEKGCNSCKY